MAIACKSLLRRYKWNHAVAEKGDENARYHFGIMAQDLQDAFQEEGLDATQYGMFIKNTWYEVAEEIDGDMVVNTFEKQEDAPIGAIEKTRLGVRYNELLALYYFNYIKLVTFI